MIEVEKYKDGNFVLPAVVDYIDFESHAAIDIIQHRDQVFRKEQELSYNGVKLKIQKKIKDYPIQTKANIKDRTDLRKIRYYCDKINQ